VLHTAPSTLIGAPKYRPSTFEI